MGLLDMMLYIADENAKEFKQRDAAQTRIVTASMMEDLEWDAFKTRLNHQKELLRVGENFDDVAEEDDIDMLLALAEVLETAKVPLTISEIVRVLQHNRVLSLEFTSTARAQTKRLLLKMRELNRAWQDTQGRWSKL